VTTEGRLKMTIGTGDKRWNGWRLLNLAKAAGEPKLKK